MKIIFFRHGETDSNVKEIMQGAGVDTPLNVKGIKQAQKLADKAKGLGLEKIYSSTLTRAIQTATLVAAECGLDVEPIEGVEEFHYGEVEGMLISEACEKFGTERVLFFTERTDLYDTSLPGGETINQCLARLLSAIERIKNENQGKCKCVGIFSHGAVMCLLYYHFFKVHHPIANCEWFEVEV